MRNYNKNIIRLQEMHLTYNKLERLISEHNTLTIWGRYDVLLYFKNRSVKITKILITHEEEIIQQISIK